MFEQLKLLVRQHSSEIAIVGIMFTVIGAITFLATGDISQTVEAGRRR